MRRSFLCALAMACALPAAAAAQTSQFGIRGLGLPGRSLSAFSLGTAGSFGLFDGFSSLSPASIGDVPTVTAVFTGVQDFRSAETPAGSASLRSSRFPLVQLAGPVPGQPIVLSFGYSNYATRDFTLATADTISIRGAPVAVADTFSSRGGLGDIRAAAAIRLGERWTVGAAGHLITGSNRIDSRRSFGDSLYAPVRQRNELSYAGAGVSLGVVGRLRDGLRVAALARWDGHVSVDRDSTRTGEIDLPYSFGVGVQWSPSERLDVSGQALYRTWSAANSDLLSQGGTGADNTIDLSIGAQYTPDPQRPARRPIRFGARYATLPFPLVPGEQPSEITLAAGTGFRFAQERAGIDVALERAWRSGGEGFSETAWLVSLGISVRP